MRILSIETSCDETAIALVETSAEPPRGEALRGLPSFSIKKQIIASQIETHRPWGGVVPNLAKREHQENLPKLLVKILRDLLQVQSRGRIDLIAVTVGPGLEPCLWQGIEFAKKIQKENFPKAKIVPTNHLHGHMYSFLLTQHKNNQLPNYSITTSYHKLPNYFPAIQLLVSGGHTILLLMESLAKYRKLGETRDDAAGEAYDKVARMLNLPYPGGPEIEKLAKTGNSNAIPFPRPMLHDKSYDFSFSGLKTAVLYYLKNTAASHKTNLNDIATSFQEATLEVLTAKTLRATKEYGAKSIILSGGVAANSALRRSLQNESKKIGANFLSADKKFQGDNAVMIAVAGYITYQRKKTLPLKANGTLDI